MENSTKALLIGAGVLFAVVIISIAIVAYQNISGYYQSKQSNISQEQLSAFNTEYSTYERDLTGFELVGLINKISDFNTRNLEEDGYKAMSIKVTITDTSSYNGELFSGGTYTGKNNSISREDLLKKIENMKKLENQYNSSVLSKLVENRNFEKIEEYGYSGEDKKTIKDIIGKNLNTKPTILELGQYEDYIAFKRAKFEYVSPTEYTNGQITGLSYKSK